MEAAGIVVEGVRRSFGSTHAVRDMTFSAAPGRVTALIGPNGAGKTTLMLMLATLLAPDAGTIRIAGLDPAADAAGVRAALGWMPDVLGSWASLTTRTTLQLTGRLHRMPKDRAAARADELIALVGLEGLADRPTRVLSRGQKQRLSLARALVHDPAVLLLDEPASGLDPEARVELRTLVRRLADEGRTLLVSSHVLAELEEMADDAVYVQEGRTVDPERVAALRTAARPWRLRALDPAALDAALAARGLTGTQDHLGRLVEVADEAAAADLLAALVADGVRITAFGPAAGEFERTFLELAKEQER
jgi:ABC-2 type transport system ATP-binding protein